MGLSWITTLNRLLFLQKRIVRLLSYADVRRTDFSIPPSNPFKEQLLKVHDIFKMRITKFIYYCVNKTSPVNFQSWFKLTVQVHNHNTRSQYINIDKLITTNNLFIPTARTSHYGLKLIKVQGPKIWNEIPALIRSSNSSNNLKKNIKKLIIQSYNIQ